MNLRHHIRLIIILAAVWLLLSGHYTVLLIGLGSLSCAICGVLYHRISTESKLSGISLDPLPLAKYTVWLLIEIIKSNLAVIRAILSGENISPKIFEVETSNLDEPGQVIYANSITLTPGTVSTDISEGKIQVHGLLAGAEDSFADNEMRARIQKLISD